MNTYYDLFVVLRSIRNNLVFKSYIKQLTW